MGKVLIIGGGLIPEEDKPFLRESGIKAIFSPGTRIDEIADFIKDNVRIGS